MALCGKDKTKYINRLNRIEGQIRGLKKMVIEGRDCMNVLKQVAATAGATRSLGITILEEHLKGCVSGSIRDQSSDEELIHQVIEIFNKFSK